MFSLGLPKLGKKLSELFAFFFLLGTFTIFLSFLNTGTGTKKNPFKVLTLRKNLLT